MKRSYYDAIETEQSKGTSREEALAKYGMWTEAIYFSNYTNGKDYGLGEESNEKIWYALALKSAGFTMNEIKQITDINRVEANFVNNNEGDVKRNIREEAQVHAENLYKKGEDAKDIKAVAGASMEKIKKGVDYHKQHKENRTIDDPYYQKKYWRKTHPNAKSQISEAVKQSAYERWKSGECTQQELAIEFNVTRTTVVNWVREYKVKDIENLKENTPTTRRRNVGEKQRNSNKEQTEKVLEAFKIVTGGLTPVEKENSREVVSSIAKQVYGEEKYLNKYTFVLTTLRKEGLVPTMYENNRSFQKEGTELLKQAYNKDVKAFFGYGPNAGTSGYDANKGLTNKDYAKNLNKQRETGYELNNHSRARQIANATKGDLMPYWDEKKALKNAPVLGNVSKQKDDDKER